MSVFFARKADFSNKLSMREMEDASSHTDMVGAWLFWARLRKTSDRPVPPTATALATPVISATSAAAAPAPQEVGRMQSIARGFDVYVLPMRRKDWLRVVRALFTPAYWSSSCTTAPGYTWYLERVKEVVDQARLECKADQVDLIGHSAGGWLGRAFIGQQQFKEGPDSSDFEPHEAVRSLVTLGTPHTPPPPEKASAKDRTGGALTWTNTLYPGAFFAETHDLKYVSVAGRAVRGDKDADRRSLPGYAAGSYEEVGLRAMLLVCGDGHGVEGDAVVPLSSALLEGAQHVVLDGVYHSMSKIRTFNEPSGNIWYGSEEVLDAWLARLVS
eukprot:scaffold14.g1212.t1